MNLTINSLDPSQKNTLEAILNAKEDDNVFLVYGPPGTGKSQLVVSLLFELAKQNKKVLFVSQNTEALQVIDRMISSIEKEINYTSGSNLSLKDFCLKLYSGEDRYLKHIRAQYSRLSGKFTPTLNLPSEESSVQRAPSYPLGYVQLDSIKNYNVLNEKIGIDELLKYYIQYVPEELMIEPLQDFRSLDLRTILSLIDKYKFKDRFYFYNSPQNELKYISFTNLEMKFDEIHSNLIVLKSIVEEVQSEVTLKTKKEIYLSKYLSLLESYHEASKHLNLYNLYNKKTSLAEFKTEIKSVLKFSKLIIPEDDILLGIEDVKEAIDITANYIDQISKNSIEFDNDIQLILSYFSKLKETIKDIEIFQFYDLFLIGLKSSELNLNEIIKRSPNISIFTGSEILSLISEAKLFEAKSKIIKPFSKLPEIFTDKLRTTDRSIPKYIVENTILFTIIGNILGDTDYSVNSLIDWQNELPKTHLDIVQPFQNISQSETFQLLTIFVKLMNLLNRYNFDFRQEFGLLFFKIQKIHQDNIHYEQAKDANHSKIIGLSTIEFLENINRTIDNQKSIIEIKKTLSKYEAIILNSDSVVNFIEIVPALSSFLEKNIENLLDLELYFQIPVEYQESKYLYVIDRLETELKTLKQKNIYSESFFVLSEGQNLKLWYQSISHLSYFNNISEFDNYIEHNKFIHNLEIELGLNREWLKSLFSTPDLVFTYFSSRLVNTLIRSAFNNLSPQERPSIAVDFFKNYQNQLLLERFDYYVKGLLTIKENTITAASKISVPINWETGSTSMEKIRNNSFSISRAFPIIAATPKDVAKFIISEKEIFDFVIFDEASQLLPGQAIPSLFRSKTAVVIGDPHQMPPILSASISMNSYEQEDEEEDAGESILDLLRKQAEKQYHLKVHYRSESNLLFEPSRTAIYNEDGIEPIYEAKFTSQAPILIKDNLGYEEASAENENKKRSNQINKTYDKNFDKICQQVYDYLNQDNDATFCILFTRMEDLISYKDFLAANEGKYKDIFGLFTENKILLSTVSNCQGIEGTFSILYFRHYDNPGGMWFFNETAGAYKRLNVSITRQRRSLALLMADSKEKWLQVCESKLSNMQTGPNGKRSAELLRSLLTNAGKVINADYLDKTLKNNVLKFDSPLTEQLYNLLTDYYKSLNENDIHFYCEVGWHIRIPSLENISKDEKNIGFRIDIGVYSVKQAKFILGIEMDGATYHKGFDKQHSDYNRLNVLKNKGWDIYRVWSTNWLNNPKSEFKELVNYINDKLTE